MRQCVGQITCIGHGNILVILRPRGKDLVLVCSVHKHHVMFRYPRLETVLQGVPITDCGDSGDGAEGKNGK